MTVYKKKQGGIKIGQIYEGTMLSQKQGKKDGGRVFTHGGSKDCDGSLGKWTKEETFYAGVLEG